MTKSLCLKHYFFHFIYTPWGLVKLLFWPLWFKYVSQMVAWFYICITNGTLI
jgi:hypothetical protein